MGMNDREVSRVVGRNACLQRLLRREKIPSPMAVDVTP